MALPLTGVRPNAVLATAAAVVAVGVDQAMRGEPLLTEWWVDVPVAALLAFAVWLLLTRAGRDRESRWPDAELERAHAIDEVVAAVNRGAPVESIMQNLARQTPGILNVERTCGEREWETLDRLAEVVSVALEQAQMRRRLEQAVETGVEAMATAVDMRDTYTGEHSDAVVDLALGVGRRMGLRDSALGELEFAARLHDVGKIGVPDAVLLKEGPLDSSDWEIMRQHPEWGARMLTRMPGLRRVAQIVRHAHERWDGEGYPDCMRGDTIPLESRIIFACDAYHAMTSNRPYRQALRPWVAVSELREGAGSQFDPDVIDALVGALREERTHMPFLFREAAVRAA